MLLLGSSLLCPVPFAAAPSVEAFPRLQLILCSSPCKASASSTPPCKSLFQCFCSYSTCCSFCFAIPLLRRFFTYSRFVLTASLPSTLFSIVFPSPLVWCSLGSTSTIFDDKVCTNYNNALAPGTVRRNERGQAVVLWLAQARPNRAWVHLCVHVYFEWHLHGEVVRAKYLSGPSL